MIVLMYHKRFVPLIQSGQKTQTIRPHRRQQVNVGDELSHRYWEGKGYRSPQVEILRAHCSAVFDVHVTDHGIGFGEGLTASSDRLEEFARADGFSSWRAMRDWYLSPGGYGLPFSGLLIQWPRKCEMCGQEMMGKVQPGELKGLCDVCSNALGGGVYSATIVREERNAMKARRR